jgi:hypothetical protein
MVRGGGRWSRGLRAASGRTSSNAYTISHKLRGTGRALRRAPRVSVESAISAGLWMGPEERGGAEPTLRTPLRPHPKCKGPIEEMSA